MSKRFYILSLIAFLLISLNIVAQERLSGKVLNSDKRSLEYATIILIANDTLVGGTVTNSKGQFMFEEIQQGNYLLQVSLLGYKTIEQNIALKGEREQLPDIILQEDTLMLSEVTVKANRADNIVYSSNATIFHLSENALKNSVNIYEALQEVPKLIVDVTERRIKLPDGSSPLILINGINRPGYLNSLDPSDVVAIELIENPSARYRGKDEPSTVLNLKVRRKKEVYAQVSSGTNQHVVGNYGDALVSAEIGNEKLSGFLNVQHAYFREDYTTESELNSGEIFRTLATDNLLKVQIVNIKTGGDWLISDRDYLLLDIMANIQPQFDNRNGNGLLNFNIPITDVQSLKYHIFNNSNAIFYRHTFKNTNILELTGRIGYDKTTSKGWREEATGANSYREAISLDNNRISYALDAYYGINDLKKVAIGIGSNSYFHRFNINNEFDNNARFTYREGREYLYTEIYNKTQSKFSYAFSTGIDMVFSHVNGIQNHYINFIPQFTLSYAFKQQSILRLLGSRSRTSPSPTQLNPYNTSTDSLNIIEGNPYLTPAIDNQIGLRHEWTYKNFFLNTSLLYHHYSDQIESIGKQRGNVYYSSYSNIGEHDQLAVSAVARIRLGNFGNISGGITYTRDFYNEGFLFSGNSLSYWGNINLQYKKISFSSYMFYGGNVYERISKAHYKTESAATLAWQISPAWRINIGLRYLIPTYNDEYWTHDKSYYSHELYKRENLLPMIGFSFNFRSKNPQKRQQREQISNTTEDFNFQLK